MSSELLIGVENTPTGVLVPAEKTLLLPEGVKSETAQPERPKGTYTLAEVEALKKNAKNSQPPLPPEIEKARTVPVSAEALNRRFKHFPDYKPEAPVLALRGRTGVTFRPWKDKTGFVPRQNPDKPLGKDNKALYYVPRFAQGSTGYIQVCSVEVRRCAKAIKSREAAIANAEVALAKARREERGTLVIEKAQERVEIAKIKRDFTVAKFEYMLEYAKNHNLKTLEKRKPLSDEDKKNKKNEKKLIVIAAAESIKHLDEVKEDYLLAAAVQANGSRSHDAFAKIRDSYKWMVNKFARPGATPLEIEDAFTRGIEGLWDAARRFDPLRKGKTGKGARFGTVAHNWVRRNTRARTNADVKPGQFKVSGQTKFLISIDGQVNNEDEACEFTLASVASTEMSDSMKYDVAEALASLNETQQTILKLHHFDNKSIKEISGIVNLPVNSIKMLVGQAHVLLQSKLAGYTE